MARPKEGYHNAAGEKIVGVTTAIKTLGEAEGLIFWAWRKGKEGVDYKALRDKAADIGTITHDLIEQFLRSGPEPESAINARRNDYEKACRAFHAWREWFDKEDLHVESFERPLVSEIHQFGGTPDALARRGNGPLVIMPDWKTSKDIYPEYLAQLGGYAILLEENAVTKIEEALILRADKEKDMTWEVVRLDEAQLLRARKAFLAALKAYTAREELKVLLRKVKT